MNSRSQAASHALSDEAAGGPSTGELWALYNRTHAVEHRNELLLRYIGLVRRAVGRLYASAHHYHDYDDLLSCGVIGLMDAFERFDPDRGIHFESYASIRIRGEIIDYMRRQDWAPVHLRLRLRQVEAAVAQLSQSLGRSPTDSETAGFLGMPLADLQSLLGEAHWLNVVHFDDLLGGCPDDNPALAQDALFDRACEQAEMQALLRAELGRLSEKEQRILSLYYEEGLTLKEIGQVMGLSESRISQIHSGTLLKLRTRLGRQPRDRPPRDRPPRDQTPRDQTPRDRPPRDRPVRDQTVRDQTLRDMPAPPGSRKTQAKDIRKTFDNTIRATAPATAELPAMAGDRR